MPLSEAEKLELAQLEKELAPTAGGLSPKEQAELAQLEAEVGGQAPPAQDQFSPAEAVVEGFGQGASLGYLPKLQAASMSILHPELTYEKALKQMLERGQAIQAEEPVASAAGTVGGALALPIPGAASVKGATLAAKVGRAATTGGAVGFAANPGENLSLEENLMARLKSAGLGAGLGGIAQSAGSGLASLPEKLSKTKTMMALKQAGGRFKDFKETIKKGTGKKIEQFMQKEGMLTPGKTFENVAEKADEIVDDAGKQIQKTYQDVTESSAKELNLETATPQNIQNILSTKPNATQMADEFLTESAEKLTGKSGGQQALKTIEGELQNLKALGDEPSIGQMLDYRKSLDDNIRWNKTYGESPAAMQRLRDLRNAVQGRINKHIDALDTAFKSKNTALLKKINERYSNAKTVQNMSQDKLAREEARSVFGLLPVITGTGLASAEIAQGKDPTTALAHGLLTAGATRAARTYGPGLTYQAARGAEALTRRTAPLERIPVQSYTLPWLLMGNKNER